MAEEARLIGIALAGMGLRRREAPAPPRAELRRALITLANMAHVVSGGEACICGAEVSDLWALAEAINAEGLRI